MTKKPWQRLKYLEDEKSFWDEIKSIFRLFKGLSIKEITQIFLEGESPTLIPVSIFLKDEVYLPVFI